MKATFECTLLQHIDFLKESSRKFIADREERMDLVQETLLKALVNQEKFNEGSNMKAWLYTVLRNIYINQYHQAKYKQTTCEDLSQQDWLHKDNHTPQNDLRYQEIQDKIEKLSPKLREPLKLYSQGYKYQEIGEMLEIPIGTVKNKIFLARQDLEKMI